MHWVCSPFPQAQQSLFCEHFSYSCEQPIGGGTQAKVEPPSAALVDRQ